MSQQATKLPFVLTPTPIDYFKLNKEHFPAKDFDVTFHDLTFSSNEEYLDVTKHLPSITTLDKETIVLNLPVGRGKTKLFYDLVIDYCKKNYYVIVCSPFLKLVQKDLDELSKQIPKRKGLGDLNRWPVFYAEDFSEPDESRGGASIIANDPKPFYGSNSYLLDRWIQEYPIHVMTINRLLGFVGKEGVQQNKYKKRYIDQLRRHVLEDKVVFFVDEIHESSQNFKSELIPRLLKWIGKVEKVFIASATFTPATLPIIKTFSLLTDSNITVYQTERKQMEKPADLHLHISPSPYGPESSFPKAKVKELVDRYNKAGTPVQIITGTKAMAEKYAQYLFPDAIEKDTNRPDGFDYINLLVGGSTVEFQPAQNNIGTTLTTGVNITDSNGVLILILPSITGEKRFSFYGIFSNGISPLTQAIGRLRKGGTLHLFMYEPQERIGLASSYPKAFSSATPLLPHRPLNEMLPAFENNYDNRIKHIKKEIRLMERKLRGFKVTQDMNYKWRFGFWYPNFQEYLLTHRSAATIFDPSFGRGLSPYVLWAALHNQFANAKLSAINYYNSKPITLSIEQASKVFKSVFSSQKVDLKGMGFRGALDTLSSLLSFTHKGEDIQRVTYQVGVKMITAGELVNSQHSYNKVAVQELYNVFFQSKFPFTDKFLYLRTCMQVAAPLSAAHSTLISLYQKLKDLQTEFITWLTPHILQRNGKAYLPKDVVGQISPDFVSRARQVLLELSKMDKMFYYKVFSFHQHLGGKVQNADKEIFKTFLGITYSEESTKQIQRKQYIQVKQLPPVGKVEAGLLS